MGEVVLLASPEGTYLDELLRLIARARSSLTLICGFASPTGVALIYPALQDYLRRPEAQAHLILPIDRQGFNTPAVLYRLLELKRPKCVKSRLELGLVPEKVGLLHAKAALAQTEVGTDLLLGSANLTKAAFQANHELGLLATNVRSEVANGFKRFVTSLAATSINDQNVDDVLWAWDVVAKRPVPSFPRPEPPPQEWRDLLRVLQEGGQLPPPSEEPEQCVSQWIEDGFLVGKGRRATDALVIRLPLHSLQDRGLIAPFRKKVIGEAVRESQTLGYAIELVGAEDARDLRKAAKRMTSLLARLSLPLPCFGNWMPATYWDRFNEAREQLQGVESLSPGRILELAKEQQRYLLKRDGLDISLEQILDRLERATALSPSNRRPVKDELRAFLERELQSRTPDVVASAIEFRTARQRWAPFEQTDAPYRQLMVDVIQGTFSSTFRTGKWPTHSRSHAAREIAGRIAGRLSQGRRAVDGEAALTILRQAATWEEPGRPFAKAVEEFQALVPQMEFPAPLLEDLVRAVESDSAGENDD